MEKIEFTNPESKELNEEVRNYLELMAWKRLWKP